VGKIFSAENTPFVSSYTSIASPSSSNLIWRLMIFPLR
jgi:hypothetical protein